MMPDRERVINTIDGCINDNSFCNKCDYDGCVFQHGSCEKDLLAAALSLLKEQEEIVKCKDCIHWDKGHTEECDNLDSVCFHNGWCKPDWYCAGGKRR